MFVTIKNLLLFLKTLFSCYLLLLFYIFKRLNAKVALLSRIDRLLNMTIQNLNGVDTIVKFRPEKHGKGFRYMACQWTKKFTKPNRIYRNMK
ncbi:hypothetical protein Hanom_Chr08g00734891 [Helianthus anomalus]